MSKPAARLGDMHVCPMVTGVVPQSVGRARRWGRRSADRRHAGACMGDMAVCVGPPDTIVLGSFKVLANNKPIARMGDMTAHGGSIVLGCFTVLVS